MRWAGKTRRKWAWNRKGTLRERPAYHPRALLSVWLYGFMTNVRSCRKLEASCRDQIPYLWLTGWQHTDHHTLWRFYQRHRQSMRELFKRIVRTPVSLVLADLAVQAVDGIKVPANAAWHRSYPEKQVATIAGTCGEGYRRLGGPERRGTRRRIGPPPREVSRPEDAAAASETSDGGTAGAGASQSLQETLSHQYGFHRPSSFAVLPKNSPWLWDGLGISCGYLP